ncbi:pro-thyrotropin-releasing hormone [Paramormyrops kingsleyae]|uniref:Pro-thyrotropin-releasing hormone n=1 Tax=Paramormyrops kingsleyae TaxID=1676925 RepID=A0A3B3SMM3_9TELE|nr:thyrotropin releasing hormone [Paramormyrops kingsleyae]
MKSTFLILLAFAVCNLNVNLCQNIPDEEDEGALQRAETLLLRSILKKIEDDSSDNEQVSSLQEWVSKRQHPGKRYEDDLEKRQHPGKREEEEEGDYSDLQKRQHPGKREDEIELERRQHPGKRSMLERLTDTYGSPATYLNGFSKRQHPGKRYLVYNKRQHPGRRELEDEVNADDQADLEKRQHPGKRFWDNTSPDFGASDPCDTPDPAKGCSKAVLLLELLDNVTKSRAEEKRQHPGKRFALEDMTEQE